MLDLNGKVAVILGGAGGIGAVTCRTMAETGATVVVGFHRDEAAAQSLAASLPGAHLPGMSHFAHPMRIEDSSSLAALAATVRDRLGRTDILVNSAGFTRPIPHTDMDALDDALFDQLLAVNLRGAFAAIRAFRALLQDSAGLAITISSTAAFDGSGSNIAYAASKAGVEAMTKSLARVLAPTVRVMTIAPGAVDTDFVPGRDTLKLASGIPLKRVATAQDVANAVLALATLLPYSTGSTLLLDGGRLL